jgi:hypothetical protein
MRVSITTVALSVENGAGVMTDVETKSELSDVDTDDPDKVAHYLRKEFHEAYVTGELVTALCGHQFVPHRDPKNMPICQRCKHIYETRLK